MSLIKEYESEETEVKDLEWVKAKLKKDHKDGEMAKSQIKDGEKIDGIDLNSYWRGRQTANYIARCYLEDLDEPETLSQKWIDKHSYNVHLLGTPDVETVAIPRDDLQNLLVPKQELPVIPKFVAEWIKETKPYNSLRVAFEYIAQRKRNNHDDKLAFWVEEGNSETFARAWLDGYEIEQEPKYYARIKGWENVTTGSEAFNWVYFKEKDTIGISKAVENKYQAVSFTKNDWNNLGINEHNADFVLVEELEE